MTRLARPLAIAAAFLLPLGAVGGIIGVVLGALHLLAFGRRHLQGDGRWLLVLAPLALTPLLATLASPDPTPARIAFAGLLVIPILVGWLAVRRLVADAGRDRVAGAFVAGAVVLAASVLVEAAFGANPIPAGLFRGTLHNTTGAVLVLAFPLALEFAAARRTRALGAAAVLALVAGVLAALSWVGVLGFAAAGFVFAAARGRWAGFVGAAAVVGGIAAAGWWLAPRLGAPALATLGEVLSSRARIFAEGLALAARSPWLGWGVDPTGIGPALQATGTGVFHVDDLALPHAHSLYVQTLVEGGVLGFVALVLVLAFAIATARGPWRHAVRAALVGHLATQGFDYAWTLASVVVSVGLVVALGADPDDRRPAPATDSEAAP